MDQDGPGQVNYPGGDVGAGRVRATVTADVDFTVTEETRENYDPQKTAVSSFNHLGEAWLEDPDPNPFVEFWLYNHPSVQNRARFAEHYNPWANGGQGEFFAN